MRKLHKIVFWEYGIADEFWTQDPEILKGHNNYTKDKI